MRTTIRRTLFTSMLVALVSLGGAITGLAQFGASDSSTRQLIRRIQTRTDTLQQSVQNASDRGNYRVDELSRLINDFEAATNQLDRRLGTRRNANSDARVVLDRALAVDSFMNNNRVGFGAQREWRTIRTDLDQLAATYSITPQWGSSSGTPGTPSASYNLSDLQMRQLIQRLDTRTTTFSRALRADLNNRRYRNDRDFSQASQQLSTFETSLTQLRNRFNTRQVTSTEANSLLQSASVLDRFVADRQLSYQTENGWTSLKTELDQLASAFNVAGNWNNVPAPGGGYGTSADLTGTYTLNRSQGDDVRRAVDDATRNLSLAERQRVYDSLIRRLDPPAMLAIDRRGNNVTIASSRAPQINFVADGREQVETARNGRSIKVRATLTGDALTIVRDGDRANDFSVTFDSEASGRQLIVSRTLYSERLTQAVTVRSYYDRTSSTAQLNIYDTNREETAGGSDVSDTFIIGNNTQLVAVLNSDLSTQNAKENDRFTMTVRSPGQYEGATIEGFVSSINRSGRVSGRSEMTLDFDTIRLRDGRTYRFAGILESVRTPAGEVVRVDNEGAVRDNDQTNKTVTRTAIGTAVGAIIGAIAGGGKGAAIGAAIGAGTGAGSVYVQGRNDLELTSGTEITLRATGPRG
jgi:hypothetical protein